MKPAIIRTFLDQLENQMRHTESIATTVRGRRLDGHGEHARSALSAEALRATAGRLAVSTRTAVRQTGALVRQTGAFAQAHPWLSAGTGALLGAAAGYAFSRLNAGSSD